MTGMSGEMRNRQHVYPVRVYFEDTDAFGIVYHSRYLHFAERARTEMMRLLGAEHARMMEDDGVAFAVRRCEMDLRRPAKLDDLLEIRTSVVGMGGATIDAEQVVYRPADDLDIARLFIQLACITRQGRPARLPAAVRARVQDFLTRET